MIPAIPFESSCMQVIRILGVTLATALACSAPAIGAEAPKAPAPARSASARQSVDLTVYNSDLALVREVRAIPLAKGANHVAVPDVPATIDPSSVHFGSLTDPSGVRVVEQNYQYDLVSRRKLLEKYVGRTVEFLRPDPAGGPETAVAGRLLAVEDRAGRHAGLPPQASDFGILAEIGGKVEVDPAGRLVLPGLSEGLILKPRLEWQVSSSKEGDHKAEISYLASGLSWSCDYVAVLDKDDARVDLKGWVTLVNHSGTSFQDAGLKLVAGDVNRAPQDAMPEVPRAKVMMMAEAEAPQFEQKEIFEYKLYSLQRRTDLLDNESKQIELMSATGVPVRKTLIYDGMESGWRWWLHNPDYRGQVSLGQQGDTKVGVYLVLKNEAKGGLGMPLPKGRARVYKKDSDGKEQFIGEDRLDHTPKDEEIRLNLGNAFDVVGSRAQTDFRTLSSGKVVEETFLIKVRNHKQEAVEVMVYEHPWRWSQWDLVKSAPAGEKVDQTTLRFPLKVPAGQEKTVTYTVRYSW